MLSKRLGYSRKLNFSNKKMPEEETATCVSKEQRASSGSNSHTESTPHYPKPVFSAS